MIVNEKKAFKVSKARIRATCDIYKKQPRAE
jgi:hypothetical protein